MKLKKPLGYYDYTVVLTYVGMLCAFSAIIMTLNENYQTAIVLLMVAGVCDMFDGAVANTKKRTPSEKKFGIQIDSLSDLISFCLLPAIFVYEITGKSTAASVVAAIYALAGLIRLAYYNVTEEERQQQTDECRKFFQGVPVTSIAVLLPVVYALQCLGKVHNTVVYMFLLGLCSVGFLSPIEVKKPNLVGKIVLILVGISEFVGVILLGWNLA